MRGVIRFKRHYSSCFLFLNGTSHPTLHRRQKDVNCGIVSWVREVCHDHTIILQTNSRGQSLKLLKAHAWIENTLIRDYGHPSPGKVREVHLFPETWTYYYDIYRRDHDEKGCISYPQFCKTMSSNYPFVKLTMRQKNPHARCSKCGELLEQVRSATSKQEKEKITKDRTEHWTKVKSE